MPVDGSDRTGLVAFDAETELEQKMHMPMRVVLVGLSLLCVCSVMWAAESGREPLLIPSDLYAVAESQGCSQITDFYDRPGRIDAPFVYGVTDEPEEWSAAFWCRRSAGRVSVLIFTKIGRTGMEYLGEVVTNNWPGGLTAVETAEDLPRESLLSMESDAFPVPQGALPRDDSLEGRGVRSEYDGVSSTFVYLHGGWYIYQQH